MINIHKYSVIDISLDRNIQIRDWEAWKNTVAKLLTSVASNNLLSLFTLGKVTKQSIMYDLGEVKLSKWQASKYSICFISHLSYESAISLVDEAEFYLGHTILIKQSVTEETISSLIVGLNNDMTLSGIEMFKMSCDGYCLQWYNPYDPAYAESLINSLQIND
ncbi:hypothetical protein ACFQZI_20335 [Mucilaginibacter lutimaris]|uniref:Uncharacterized protein n=1 Tax=Mucilaginibacter lutimaris TaxID=931629 RepID=A0ABW2ZLU5_9SPHI